MDFMQFAQAHGLVIRHLIADGKIHRCGTTEHPRSTNGSYKFDGVFGWVQPWDMADEIVRFKPEGKVDPAVLAEHERRAKADRQERLRGYKEAAERARQIVERCNYSAHPYFGKKGLYHSMGLVDPIGVSWRRDEAPRADCLLVPMRNFQTGNLQSVQWIDADGDKLFMTGGQAAGAVFGLGPQMASTTWLCEGYATGLSLVEALKELYRTSDRVLVCFSAGNLKRVATELGGRRLVMADNDGPDKYGRQAGQEAAKATQLPWAMPEVEDEDWNDVYAAVGPRAVAKVMREVLRM